MKIQTSEWSERISHWIRTLKDDFYAPLGELHFKACFTERQIPEEEAVKMADKPVDPGFVWGREYEYGWFVASFTLPERARGKRIVLNLDPGGESTLFLNGQPFGTYRAPGMDEPHHYFVDNTIAEAARGGEVFDFAMETYAGHFVPEAPTGGCATGPVLPGSYQDTAVEGARRRLGHCTYGVFNEDAYQLYMDVVTLQSLLTVLDPDSLRAAHVADALERFTLTVDFEQPAAGRISDYRKAREILRPCLTSECGSTAAKFYAVGNAHLDLAWLWPLEETHRKTARTFAAQLRLLSEYPDYCFLQSQPAEYEMCRKYYPDLFAKIQQAVKDGRWIADGAMWVEPDTNVPSGESLIRQLLYGKCYYRRMFDVDSVLLWLPDTFGYSGQLPQILKGCGVNYLVTQKIFWSYNDGEQFPYHYFYWQGIDGSKITSFLPTSYTYRTDPASVAQAWKSRRQKRDLEAFLYPYGYGDGGGGPARDFIEYNRREAHLEGASQVRMAGPMEFFKDGEAQGGPKHTWTGELYFSAHRGTYTSQADVKKLNRRCELALREAEIWSAFASGKGLPWPKETLDELWKKLLTLQFHDILPGSCIGKVYEEVIPVFQEVLDGAGRLTRRALASLAGMKDGGAETSAPTSREATQNLLVFNSLGFPRTAVVPLSGESKAPGALAYASLPAFGSAAAAQELPDGVPGVRLSADGEGCLVLENGYLRARIDERGEIRSLVCLSSGREFAAGPMNHLRMFRDVPRKFDAWDIDSNYAQQEVDGARDITVGVLTEDPLRCSLLVKGIIGRSPYRQEIRLDAGSRRLEIHMHIDWKETHRLLKAAFPVNVLAEEGINEIQYGFIRRPTHRSRVCDQDRFEVCNHRYSALADGSHGAALLNDCKYGISMNGNSLELSLLKAAKSPDFNADVHEHDFTYAIYPWEGTFEESDVVRQGYDLNVPPQIMQAAADAGSGNFSAGFSCDKDNCIADTIKLAEDGSGDMILRLYESKKAAVKARIALHAFAGARVFACNMLEEPMHEVPVKDGAVELDFRAFEIKTLRVKQEKKI